MIFRKRKKGNADTEIELDRIPQHIAIIMDGNGRWAKKRGLPRTAGHNEGGKTLLKVIQAANEMKIKAITVYAFSTENWKRPEDEVNYLMNLPNKYISTYLPKMKQEGIRMNFIGDLSKLPQEMQDNIHKAEEETKDNKGLIFTIGLNYGSQNEILQAVKTISTEYKEGVISLEDIDGTYFDSKLMTNDLPKVDLMIRTSGELRLSNFLLWQIAYSELYFTKKYWPDFDEQELKKAIIDYQKRNRRYGGL